MFIAEMVLLLIAVLWLVPAIVMPRSLRVLVITLGLHVLLTVLFVAWPTIAWGEPYLWCMTFCPGGALSAFRLLAHGFGKLKR